MPLGDVARVRFDFGPGLVRRENVQRVAMLTANVAGADLTGAVEKARAALARRRRCRRGTRSSSAASSRRRREACGTSRCCRVLDPRRRCTALLFLAFREPSRTCSIVLVNLPLALIGGIFGVALGEGVLSVASIVGFIALFGVATRNGVLLVSHYEHLMREEGASLRRGGRRGSHERLAPVLMTALTAGPRAHSARPGRRAARQRDPEPDGRVILGGLLTSTFLNLVVVPVLFARWGAGPSRVAVAA